MRVWPEGVDRLILDQTDSTNAEAARRAADPATPVPLWIMARRQTAGRGRRGRAWADPGGNLAATLLMRPRCPASVAAQYSFVACLATADLLSALAPEAEVRLKWPNDALLNGGKAAGILLESSGRGAQVDWLAVGIGVNLASAPADETVRPGGTRPTSLLAEAGHAPGAETALTVLAAAFERWQARFEREGFAPIRAAWLARAAHLGRTIGAGLATERLTGIFEDVDATGALVLRTGAGRRTVSAADLYFPE